MKCPVCSKELKELRVDDLTVDVCELGCGGVWFDAFELQKVDDTHDATGGKLAVKLEKISVQTPIPDKDIKRACPRCGGVKLKKHFFSPKRQVRVDQCPNCAGYWLDHGELQAIRAETLEKAVDDSQPKRVPMEVIRRLYRMRIEEAGADTGASTTTNS